MNSQPETFDQPKTLAKGSDTRHNNNNNKSNKDTSSVCDLDNIPRTTSPSLRSCEEELADRKSTSSSSQWSLPQYNEAPSKFRERPTALGYVAKQLMKRLAASSAEPSVIPLPVLVGDESQSVMLDRIRQFFGESASVQLIEKGIGESESVQLIEKRIEEALINYNGHTRTKQAIWVVPDWTKQSKSKGTLLRTLIKLAHEFPCPGVDKMVYLPNNKCIKSFRQLPRLIGLAGTSDDQRYRKERQEDDEEWRTRSVVESIVSVPLITKEAASASANSLNRNTVSYLWLSMTREYQHVVDNPIPPSVQMGTLERYSQQLLQPLWVSPEAGMKSDAFGKVWEYLQQHSPRKNALFPVVEGITVLQCQQRAALGFTLVVDAALLLAPSSSDHNPHSESTRVETERHSSSALVVKFIQHLSNPNNLTISGTVQIPLATRLLVIGPQPSSNEWNQFAFVPFKKRDPRVVVSFQPSSVLRRLQVEAPLLDARRSGGGGGIKKREDLALFLQFLLGQLGVAGFDRLLVSPSTSFGWYIAIRRSMTQQVNAADLSRLLFESGMVASWAIDGHNRKYCRHLIEELTVEYGHGKPLLSPELVLIPHLAPFTGKDVSCILQDQEERTTTKGRVINQNNTNASDLIQLALQTLRVHHHELLLHRMRASYAFFRQGGWRLLHWLPILLGSGGEDSRPSILAELNSESPKFVDGERELLSHITFPLAVNSCDVVRDAYGGLRNLLYGATYGALRTPSEKFASLLASRHNDSCFTTVKESLLNTLIRLAETKPDELVDFLKQLKTQSEQDDDVSPYVQELVSDLSERSLAARDLVEQVDDATDSFVVNDYLFDQMCKGELPHLGPIPFLSPRVSVVVCIHLLTGRISATRPSNVRGKDSIESLAEDRERLQDCYKLLFTMLQSTKDYVRLLDGRVLTHKHLQSLSTTDSGEDGLSLWEATPVVEALEPALTFLGSLGSTPLRTTSSVKMLEALLSKQKIEQQCIATLGKKFGEPDHRIHLFLGRYSHKLTTEHCAQEILNMNSTKPHSSFVSVLQEASFAQQNLIASTASVPVNDYDNCVFRELLIDLLSDIILPNLTRRIASDYTFTYLPSWAGSSRSAVKFSVLRVLCPAYSFAGSRFPALEIFQLLHVETLKQQAQNGSQKYSPDEIRCSKAVSSLSLLELLQDHLTNRAAALPAIIAPLAAPPIVSALLSPIPNDSTAIEIGSRMYSAMVPTNRPGVVFVLGGPDNTTSMLAFDVNTNTVTRVVSERHLPPHMSMHTATTFNGKTVYLIGHQYAANWQPLLLTTDPAKAELSRITLKPPMTGCLSLQLPQNLHGHSAVPFTFTNRHGETSPLLYIFGGGSRQSLLADLVRFDVQCYDWKTLPRFGEAPWPAPRKHHAAVAVDNRYMFLYGGMLDNKTIGDQCRMSDELWCFDVDEGDWTLLNQEGVLPGKRSSCSMVYDKPYLYLLGGHDGASPLCDLYRVNLTLSMHSQSRTVLWERVHVFHHNNMEQNGVEGGLGNWQQIGGQPSSIFPSYGSASCLVSKHRWVFCGGMLQQRFAIIYLPGAEACASLRTTGSSAAGSSHSLAEMCREVIVAMRQSSD